MLRNHVASIILIGALSDALAFVLLVVLALSLPVLLVAAFLPHERRKKLLRWLGLKWVA